MSILYLRVNVCLQGDFLDGNDFYSEQDIEDINVLDNGPTGREPEEGKHLKKFKLLAFFINLPGNGSKRDDDEEQTSADEVVGG